MKSAETIPKLNDVDQTVEIVRGQHEAVSLLHRAPSTKHEVAGETVLERPRKVLVEDRVEVVVIRPRVSDFELRGQPRVAVVCPLGVVIPLPELDWADIGTDKDGGAEERVEGRGEDAREDRLEEQHGGVGDGEGLGEGVEG